MPTFHRHHELELNLMLGGSVTYLMGGRRFTLQAGQLALLWAAMPHRVVATQDPARVVWLTVPLQQVLQWNLPARLLNAALHGNAVLGTRTDPGDPERFSDWSTLLDSSDPEARRIVLLELEARLRRLALHWTGTQANGPAAGQGVLHPLPEVQAGKVERMTAHLAAHYASPVRLADVAAHVNLNPTYASTLFRQALGTTVVEYLTQLRVAHAQRLLLTTTLPVLDVMQEAGFQSSSHFHEVFTRACQQSPREFRRQFAACPSVQPGP